jgi:hypothetical protein
MIRDALLAFGVLSAAAYQLRSTAGLGPGELSLLLWLVLTLGYEVMRLGPPLTRPLLQLLGFWIAFAGAMAIGTAAGYALGDLHDVGLFAHDVLAYGLMACISIMCVIQPVERLQRILWLVAGIGIGWLALQIALGWQVVDPPANIDPWYWDRLRGVYENPNQLALLCAILGLIALHLATVSRGVAARGVALLCIVSAVVVGRLTKSDTFLIVLIVSPSIFGALTIRRWFQTRAPKATVRFAVSCVVIVAVPPVIAMGVYFRDVIGLNTEQLAYEMAKGSAHDTEETARVRLVNWGKAFDRGVETGMLGLGPGPHIEIPHSILAGRDNSNDQPRNMNSPQPGLAPNFEAHNTVMDLFAQGGLLAVLSLAWLAATTILATYKTGLDGLTTLLCALGIFSIFHLMVRHPIVWLVIAVCLVTAAKLSRTAPVPAWR